MSEKMGSLRMSLSQGREGERQVEGTAQQRPAAARVQGGRAEPPKGDGGGRRPEGFPGARSQGPFVKGQGIRLWSVGDLPLCPTWPALPAALQPGRSVQFDDSGKSGRSEKGPLSVAFPSQELQLGPAGARAVDLGQPHAACHLASVASEASSFPRTSCLRASRRASMSFLTRTGHTSPAKPKTSSPSSWCGTPSRGSALPRSCSTRGCRGKLQKGDSPRRKSSRGKRPPLPPPSPHALSRLTVEVGTRSPPPGPGTAAPWT